jgi:hypothetical protein
MRSSRRHYFHRRSTLTGQNSMLKNPKGLGMNGAAERRFGKQDFRYMAEEGIRVMSYQPIMPL